ncbi:hypothetical protein K438DRAFT_1938667 [Mycena galopus ATCC 62051]|nr:hypothetical protein K438DRAFT_1938667 [Mycena galopus ATCC 62051]
MNFYHTTWTPLYHAAGILPCDAVGTSLERIQFLLAAGADPNVDHRKIPLFHTSNPDVRQALVDAGPNLHAEDDSGKNALPRRDAGPYDVPPWIDLLLQFGAATVDKPALDGQTPVDVAMSSNLPEIVKTLEPLVQDPDVKRRIATWWVERDE